MSIVEIKVPDIGGHESVDIIAVEVKAGDTIAVDDTLITLETDKATMDVPADAAGVVKEVKVKVGDKISEGGVILTVETGAAAAEAAPAAAAEAQPAPAAAGGATVQVAVPDIGGHTDVDVIAVEIKVGDTVAEDDTLITLETDKATMDVPCTAAGVVKAVFLEVGDKVSEGSAIIEVETAGSAAAAPAPAAQAAAPAAVPTSAAPAAVPTSASPAAAKIDEAAFAKAHAGPSARKLARELGVDLDQVKGSGLKGRIMGDDIKAFVKSVMQGGAAKPAAAGASLGGGLDLLPWYKVDFSKFGNVEVKELSRIKKISGQNLSRNWVVIPHVTVHEEADMTELEEFRKQLNKEWEREGVKLSPLAFIIKASVSALKAFPEFNASLDGDNLVLKNYFNIGFAADTPNGLVVPVSACFTISSLGGIGGTGFTPIVNAPEVAILGVCKSQIKPVWNGKEFAPRLMCPLSLSFDHRVIDGAAGMRFTVFLANLLKDFRRITL
ncbi:dihydrolipoyllysine-residue acetyltransferase [Neisseria gonorrhoeae]|nr:dihydrolipoyllysine-residue acetyltransferase [Neisseria gonorrhoeae]